MSGLNICRFCGEPALGYDKTSLWWDIVCKKCGIKVSGKWDTEAQAVEAYTRRRRGHE
jgi:ribosomal protein L37AE/L43A